MRTSRHCSYAPAWDPRLAELDSLEPETVTVVLDAPVPFFPNWLLVGGDADEARAAAEAAEKAARRGTP